MMPPRPLREQQERLRAGETTSLALTESAIARAEDADGEGGRVFIKLDGERARAEAEASDRLRGGGVVPSPIAGLPISVKDLFDVAGEVTTAGSRAMSDAPAAMRDSMVVARLRRAGAIIMGRTNMTEFAYSGIGINPHFGTPKNPWDRATGRIPGGSSSGAAISVTDGMAVAAIGTDTGGSVRIPSALTGLTGFKPTTGRIPLDGVFPLSKTLDSAGPLAPSVACCAMLDAILAGLPPEPLPTMPVTGLRLAVPRSLVLDDLDDVVAETFSRTLTRLSGAGAHVVDIPLRELAEIPVASVNGGVLGAEAYALHRARIAASSELVDPRVLVRITRGEELSAADYIDICRARADIMTRADAVTSAFDAVLMPTVAVTAPPIADVVASEDLYAELNPLCLRNTTTGNFLDRCALTIPCHTPGDAPVGLMVMGETGGDRRLISVGLGIEAVLRTE
jgi:aspartyl-tRNA(Asn)/glutamyl-tRNA(Gln) amidotransferase subunit A